MKKNKVVVVMPAYNVEKTLEKTYRDIPKNLVDDIILVDNNSRDHTVELAKKLKIKVYRHKTNRGYGGSQKTLYRKALDMGADIIIMVHPDYQYDPKFLKYLLPPIIDGAFDIMLATRIRTRKDTLKNGMRSEEHTSELQS